MNDPIDALVAWHDQSKPSALATVIETWGSAPRPVGSLLAISQDAELVGSVSGGCVEGAVVSEALEMMNSGAHQILEFGVSDDEAFAVGLACGGRIKVLVQDAKPLMPLLMQVVAARAKAEPIALVTNIETGGTDVAATGAYLDRFRTDKSGFEDATTFVGLHNTPLRLFVVGGVHIAQALVPMAQIAGYAVTVIDPREAFASPARFPEIELSHEWPDEAVAALEPDARTAIVTLTHDPKIDDPALDAALTSQAFYIGCLGSTRTHAKRVLRLRDAGHDPNAIARLDAPVGLDIGAKTPAEIAIAILAAMTAQLRQA